MATDSLWLVSPAGERLLLLDRFVRLETTTTVNGIGLTKIKLKNDFDLAQYVQEDTHIEIWRRVEGQNIKIDGDTVWFVRDWGEILNRAGRQVEITAYSANEILDRPIVAYASGTAQAKKTNIALDDAMKAFVRENLGSLATDSSRDFSSFITVAPDLSHAPLSGISAAWDDLFGALVDMAQDSDEKATKLFFGMVYNPNDGGLTFETRIGQWGVDHSLNDDSRVVLSIQSGTLSEISEETLTSVEKNVMYTGGRGEGTDRDIVTSINTSRLAIAPLNRREKFINASNIEKGDLDALADIGEARLKANRIVTLFTAKVRNNPNVRYGIEYNLGDRVLVESKDQILPVRVDTVKRIKTRGRETITVGLRGD